MNPPQWGKSRNEGPSRFWGSVLHGRAPNHGDSCFNAPENSSRFPTNFFLWLPESLPSLICLGFCLFCLVWYSGVNPFLVRLAGSTNRAPSIYATPHQLQLVCSSKAGVIHSPCSWLGSPAIRYRCCASSFGYLSAGVVCWLIGRLHYSK